MADPEEGRYLRAEVETMRRELADMRGELRELARSVDQLTQTFRALAVQLGLGVEPYKRRNETPRKEEPTGFG